MSGANAGYSDQQLAFSWGGDWKAIDSAASTECSKVGNEAALNSIRLSKIV